MVTVSVTYQAINKNLFKDSKKFGNSSQRHYSVSMFTTFENTKYYWAEEDFKQVLDSYTM